MIGLIEQANEPDRDIKLISGDPCVGPTYAEEKMSLYGKLIDLGRKPSGLMGRMIGSLTNAGGTGMPMTGDSLIF